MSIVTGFVAIMALAVTPLVGAALKARAGSVAFDLNKELGKAREITRKFSDGLKLELSRALKSGGLVAAVGAYHSAAPEIAARQSASSGFEVRRTALKLRNKENRPNDWERQVLEFFVAKQEAGSSADGLEHYDLIGTKEGDRLFRYMKAIPASQSCLDCHGRNMTRKMSAEIAKYYEDDKSRGFKAGQVIGAFTLIKIID